MTCTVLSGHIHTWYYVSFCMSGPDLKSLWAVVTHWGNCTHDRNYGCPIYFALHNNTSNDVNNFYFQDLRSMVYTLKDENNVRVRSHLTTTMCFFCRHVRTVTLVTMQPISDDIFTMSKICAAVTKCERALSDNVKRIDELIFSLKM